MTERPNFIDLLIAQLDKDQPRWYLEWATGGELLTYSKECLYYDSRKHGEAVERVVQARDNLKSRVARRLFHRILNAALSADIVKET